MQFRIVRNNKSSFGYRYYIQKKYFGLFWVKYYDQAYNEFDSKMCRDKLNTIINDIEEYNARKLTRNNEVM